MSYNITPTAGINLDYEVQTNPNSAGVAVPVNGPLGSQVFGSDGLRYVLGVAGAAVAASTATCSINASTFVVSAAGGSYLSPAVALASGDYAWFAAASV
jgi:hypothetical protein